MNAAFPTSLRYTYVPAGVTAVGSVVNVILLVAVVPVEVSAKGLPAL